MTIAAQDLESLIEAELIALSDPRVAPLIRSQLVPPKLIKVAWDYRLFTAYPCWLLLQDEEMQMALLFSEHGFGPLTPWGIVATGPDQRPVSMGLDSAWFRSFLDAWFDSESATRLSIWRVFRRPPNGEAPAYSDEMDWDEAWAQTMALRAQGFEADVRHRVLYGERKA